MGQQLGYITRRAILPRVVVEIYNTSPLLAALLSTADTEAGGVDSFIANVQSSQFVKPQFTGFTGQFDAPQAVSGLAQAAWSMCMAICPIPLFANEILIQSKQAIQSILNLRLNDTGNAMRDMLSYALYNWTTSSSPMQIVGLPAAIDDGTVAQTYGGIDRSLNPWWRATVYNASSVNPTRANMLTYGIGVTKQQGEAPHFAVMGMGTWAQLAQDFLGLERYMPNQDTTDKYLSAFRALEVGGIPFYADPYCPEGVCYFINTNYLNAKIHENANFELLDFQSMVPVNQLAFTAVAFLVMVVVNTKPKANGYVKNLLYQTI